MNSKERRKLRREYPFTYTRMGIFSLDDLHKSVAWCDAQFGKKNWRCTGYWGTTFKFKEEKHLTWFSMRWM